jgi:hypothetical protein
VEAGCVSLLLGEGSAAAGAQEIIASIVVAGWDASTGALAETKLAPAATHPQNTFFLNVRRSIIGTSMKGNTDETRIHSRLASLSGVIVGRWTKRTGKPPGRAARGRMAASQTSKPASAERHNRHD